MYSSRNIPSNQLVSASNGKPLTKIHSDLKGNAKQLNLAGSLRDCKQNETVGGYHPTEGLTEEQTSSFRLSPALPPSWPHLGNVFVQYISLPVLFVHLELLLRHVINNSGLWDLKLYQPDHQFLHSSQKLQQLSKLPQQRKSKRAKITEVLENHH